MFVDRFMSTAMHYPCNYGYIPHTLSDDGDPCDVLVLSPVPLITGVVVRCRPIGMLKMDDEAGGDSKILAVPIDKLSSLYSRRPVAARPAGDHHASRSPTSSSTTRISSRASGCASRAGSAPRRRSRRSSTASRADANARKRAQVLTARTSWRAATSRGDDWAARRRAGLPVRRSFPRCSSCCGAPASSPRSTGCRTRRRFAFLFYRFVLVAALMIAVAFATRAPWPRTRARVRRPRDRGAARARALPRRRVRRIRRRHGSGHERDAGRAAADPHRAPRLDVAARTRDARGSGLGLVLGLAGVYLVVRHKIDFGSDAHRARCRRRWRSSASASARCYQKRQCAHVDLRTGAVVQFTVCALVFAPLALLVGDARRALGAAVSVRARLVGAGAVGGRDQPAVLAAAPRRGGRRRAPVLPGARRSPRCRRGCCSARRSTRSR